MDDLSRILVVATDIKYSQEAVHRGVSLARKYGAELIVLHVEHDPFGIDGWNLPFLSVEEEYKNLLKEAKENLHRLIRSEMAKGLPVRELILAGEPTAVVLKVIREERIDLLVLLAQEEGRLEHFLFGRTNDILLRRMPCSVLLVKKSTAG